MHLYTSNGRGNHQTTIFPNMNSITDVETIEAAVRFDHVSASYKKHYRSVSNFILSDVVVLDLDNDHSNNPSEWITMESFSEYFEGVEYYLVASRNYLKVKGNQSARPRFHVYFPIEPVEDAQEYKILKEAIVSYFSYFDHNALDSARMIFGVEVPQVMYCPGKITICQFIKQQQFFTSDSLTLVSIPEGSRNSTMSQYAGRVLIRLGNTDEARTLFEERAKLCHPPLEQEELDRIWQSAVKFGQRVSSEPNYIPPEQFNTEFLYQPEDYSDVGQALVLAEHFRDQLRYSPATSFLVYNGSYWEESDVQAVSVVHQLTDLQLLEAEEEVSKNYKLLKQSGGMKLLNNLTKKKAMEALDSQQQHIHEKYSKALTYRDFVIQRRNQKFVQAALRLSQHLIEVKPEELDKDEFFLNTPSKTYNLKTGEELDHQAHHFITKQTSIDVKKEDSQVWQDALKTFFLNDQELIDYVQDIVGLAVIGKVYVEALIIAYGDGRNGKSTFWNTIARVLGNYSGNLSADTLTNSNRRNVKPEIAEAKGKRLLIAAELQEGLSLNTSIVKQLCSTDEIYAEKKYKSPFSFVPSHTLILYTNHLPKVGALDEGTWRRLIIIPFEAVIEGSSDIKNYADYLYEHAGGEILWWIIQGAQRVIQKDYKIIPPKRVVEAIAKYKETNDWFQQFIQEHCEVHEDYSEKSGKLYEEYRAYCYRIGEYARSTSEFYKALTSAGYDRKKKREGMRVFGLKLKSEFL